VAAVRERRDLAPENLALRQQLGVLKRRKRIPRLRRKDRCVLGRALSNLGSLAASLAPGQRGHVGVGNGRASECIGAEFRNERVEVARERIPRIFGQKKVPVRGFDARGFPDPLMNSAVQIEAA
jgi:hypothetical protein